MLPQKRTMERVCGVPIVDPVRRVSVRWWAEQPPVPAFVLCHLSITSTVPWGRHLSYLWAQGPMQSLAHGLADCANEWLVVLCPEVTEGRHSGHGLGAGPTASHDWILSKTLSPLLGAWLST